MAFRRVARLHMMAAVALVALTGFDAHAQQAGQPGEATTRQEPAAAPSPLPSGQPGAGRRGDASASSSSAELHRLPPDATTRHTLALPGRKLEFSAVAGSIRLFDDKGEPQADIAYTSYQLDGADRIRRPVTFFFNGGPGASSAWLQLGDAGPWRLSIGGEGAVASASPTCCRTPKPGSISPTWFSSIPSAPATAAS